MGRSSVRRCLFRGVSSITRPFDTKIITAGVGIPHVDIGHIAVLEQLLELGLDFSVGNVLLGNKSPSPRIGVQGDAVGGHVDGKTAILRISFTVVLMNEDGTGQRKIFLPVKRIVGEEYPSFLADGKSSQTLAARAVTGGQFGVRGMTVTRRPQCLADGVCYSVPDSHYAI
jgi:hypothetical protein